MSTGVPITLSLLTVLVQDPEGKHINWTITTSPNIGSSAGTNEYNGTKTCAIAGLTYSTMYIWMVKVNDGSKWTNKTYSFTTQSAPVNNPPIVTNPNPANMSTGVPITLSLLTVLVQDPEGKHINWTITTSPNIGSSAGTNEYNGTKTCAIAGLTYSTMYIWMVKVNDGSGWTNKTYDFTTQTASSSWWNTSWLYRKEININHFKVDANLSNFPVLINLPSDANLSAHTQPDGDDIVFTDNQGNKLNHEIELYQNTIGRLVAWVNVTYLSFATDTRLYLYYGNSLCSNQQNPQGTWNADYLMVHHMNETGNIIDSTCHALNAVNYGTTTESNGKIDGCRFFDSTTDRYDFGTPSSLNPGLSSWTISLWTKTSFINNMNILQKYGSNAGFYLKMYNNGAGGYNYFYLSDGTRNTYRYWDASGTDGNWHYLTIVINRNTNKLDVYLDGVLHNGPSGGNLANLGSITTTSNLNFRGGTNGRYDEFTISTTVRNASWIKTCYNNQNDPSRFLSLTNISEVIPPDDSHSPIKKYFTIQKIIWTFDDYWIHIDDHPPHKGFDGLSQQIHDYGGHVNIMCLFIPPGFGKYFNNQIRNFSVVNEFAPYHSGFLQSHINLSLEFFNRSYISPACHGWNHSEDLAHANLSFAYKIVNFTLWNWYNNYHIKPHFWLGHGSTGNYNISLALKRFSDTYWTVYAEGFTSLNWDGKFLDGKSPAVAYIGGSCDPAFGFPPESNPCKTLEEAQQLFTDYSLGKEIIFIRCHPTILNDTIHLNDLHLWQEWIDWIYQEHEFININHTQAIEYKLDRNNFIVKRNNAENYTINLSQCQFNHNVLFTPPDNDGTQWILHDENGNCIGEIQGDVFLFLEKGHCYYFTRLTNP
jgi:predicted double-glycine peptidase